MSPRHRGGRAEKAMQANNGTLTLRMWQADGCKVFHPPRGRGDPDAGDWGSSWHPGHRHTHQELGMNSQSDCFCNEWTLQNCTKNSEVLNSYPCPIFCVYCDNHHSLQFYTLSRTAWASWHKVEVFPERQHRDIKTGIQNQKHTYTHTQGGEFNNF